MTHQQLRLAAESAASEIWARDVEPDPAKDSNAIVGIIINHLAPLCEGQTFDPVGNKLSPTESILDALRRLVEHQLREKFSSGVSEASDFRSACRLTDFAAIASHIESLESQVRFLSNVRTELMEERDAWKAKHDETVALNNLLRINAVRECRTWKDAIHEFSIENCKETIADFIKQRDAKNAENARLRAIVDKLPKYADTGEPFVPSVDDSWAAHRDGYLIAMAFDLLPAHHEDVDQWLPIDVEYHDGFIGWFSTREAAEAAAKEAKP